MSNLVKHARRELELLGEEPEFVDGYLKVIQAVADMHHTGGSMSVFLPTLVRLLEFENLTPLTNNPRDWEDRSVQSGYPIWQNNRNTKAFSDDAGQTYWLLNELDVSGVKQLRDSKKV